MRVNYIANDPALASIEINFICGANTNSQKVFVCAVKVNGKVMDADQFTQTRVAVHIMDDAVQTCPWQQRFQGGAGIVADPQE
jgi:hypothetical protein